MSASPSSRVTDSFSLFKGTDSKYSYPLAFFVDWLEIDCHYWRNRVFELDLPMLAHYGETAKK